MLVPIIMGSPKDKNHVQAIIEGLEDFGIDYEVRVASAHKATSYLLELLAAYEEDPRRKVYITVAGLSNALSAVVDANVTGPVIACPPISSQFGGADVFSSLRLPSGIACSVVLSPKSAALCAVKMFGLDDPELRSEIEQLHVHAQQRIETDDRLVEELLFKE